MRKWVRLLATAYLLAVLRLADASACDPSFWKVEQQQGECLEVRSIDATYGITNVCSESLTLTAEDCIAACPDELEIAPADQVILKLPDNSRNNDKFRLVSTQGDSVTFSFVGNVCPSERGCHVG